MLIEPNADENLGSLYRNVKSDLELLDDERVKGQIIRASATWVEKGEKSSKFFLNLENHNSEVKHLSSVVNEEGDYVNDPNQIQNEIFNYYTKLYTAPKPSSTVDSSIFTPKATLNSLDKKYCGVLSIFVETTWWDVP